MVLFLFWLALDDGELNTLLLLDELQTYYGRLQFDQLEDSALLYFASGKTSQRTSQRQQNFGDSALQLHNGEWTVIAVRTDQLIPKKL